MSLMFRLASRNLFHDRLRFVATIVGIVFSIVLVTVQMGLYVGFGRMVTTMIDHAPADLWVMPLSTKCFEDPSLMIVSGFGPWRSMGLRKPLLSSLASRNGDCRAAGRRRFSSSAPNYGDWDCVRGIWSRVVLTICRFPARWRSTSLISSGLVPMAWAPALKYAIKR